jgi:hypothetical protein
MPICAEFCFMEEQRIGKWCNGINVGYLRELKLVATNNIVIFDEPLIFNENNLHQFSFDGLQLADDTQIFVADFYKRECTFSSKSNIDANGVFYDLNISWSWVSNNGELLNWLYRNQYKQWVAFFTDQNGISYVSGSLELPMKLFFSQGIDTKNAIKVELTSQSWHPVWFVDNLNLMALSTKIIDLRRYASRDYIAYEGDTIQEILIFRDGDGAIENLTGSTFKMDVQRADGSIVTSFTMGNGFALQNSNNELLMQKTDTIANGEYLYDLQRTYPDSTIETLMKGKFIVEPQITTTQPIR